MLNLANHPLLSARNLQKVIGEFEPSPADYALANDLPIINVDQHKIAYDIRVGAGGMTRASSRDAESPTVSFGGVAQTEFEPPDWREKVVLTPAEITSLRKLGTENEVEKAQTIITRKGDDLRYRLENRMEWMRWQALLGTLDVVQSDVEIHIDYKIPVDMRPTLTGADMWDATTSDPMDDFLQWMEIFRDLTAKPIKAMFNDKLHRILLQNTKIRAIRDSLFVGQPNMGNVTIANLQNIFNSYAGIPYERFDGGFKEVTMLTTALSASGTSLVVDDVGTIAAGNTINLLHKFGDQQARVRLSVTAVNATTKTITVASPGADVAYPVGSRVYVKKFYIPDNKFIIRGQLPGNIEGGSQWGAIISTLHPYGEGGMIDPVSGPFLKPILEDKDPPRLSLLAGIRAAPVVYHRDVNLIATVTA